MNATIRGEIPDWTEQGYSFHEENRLGHGHGNGRYGGWHVEDADEGSSAQAANDISGDSLNLYLSAYGGTDSFGNGFVDGRDHDATKLDPLVALALQVE